MIQLLETEEDACLLVAQHVANILNEGQAKTALADTPGSKFLEDCTNLLSEGRHEEFIDRIIAHLDLVFSKAPEKEADCCASVLVHAVSRIPEEKQEAAVRKLADALSSKLDDRAEERLSSLISLYSTTSSHNAPAALQLSVLNTAIDFAKKSPKLAYMLAPAVRGKADDWVREWKLSEPQARELYLRLASLAKLAGDKASVKEYLRLVTSALMAVKEGDAAALAELKPHATAALCEVVRSPSIYQCDLLTMPAVQQLAGDKQAGGVFKLLSEMVSGNLAGFKSAATPEVLEQAGISAEAALFKMRMMALLVLGSKHANQELPLSSIQSALDIPADQVESWVVRAIGAKLLEGKIDQVRSVMTITRCTHRTFGASDWKGIRSQLASWRDSLSQVSQMVQQQRPAPTTGKVTPAIKV